MTTTAIRQADQLARGAIGRLRSGDPAVIVTDTARPASQGTPQVYTISSGVPSDNTTYGLRVIDEAQDLDETITYPTDGSAAAGEVEAGLEAAWNANSVLAGIGSATDASGDLVVTMLSHTTDATITGYDAGSIALLTITETTAPSAGTAIPIARWVELLAPSGVLMGPRYRQISAPTQSVVTLTITHSGGADYSVQIQATPPDGSGLVPIDALVSWSAGGSADLTDAAAETALAAAFPGTGFVASDSGATGTVTLTAPVGWQLSSRNPTASAGALTRADTAGTLPGPLAFVPDPEMESPTTLGGSVTEVSGGLALPIVRHAPGSVWGVADSGATPSYGGVVYIETAAGANNGRPYTVQSATGTRLALPLSRSRWESVDPQLSSVHYVQGV